MKTEEILNLAANHGLRLRDEIRLNEMGMDFKVALARDYEDQQWVLRIPRRPKLDGRVRQEQKILDLVSRHLSVSVPDWKIVSPDLIAYPMLEHDPVLVFDPITHEVSWNIDQDDNQIVASLSQVLHELHRVPVSEAAESGLRVVTPQQARQELLDEIENVSRVLGIAAELEDRWRRWVETDAYWPEFSTFVHGDLYAGHILSDRNGRISGIIDWSEAEVSDPSIDFSGHLAAFGEQSLRELIERYRECGGRVWNQMLEQSRERHAASPLKYAVFVLEAGLDEHLDAVRTQLGVAE